MKRDDAVRMYTAEEMVESNIQAFKEGIQAGLAGALVAIKQLEIAIAIGALTYVDTWNALKEVLGKQIKDVGGREWK